MLVEMSPREERMLIERVVRGDKAAAETLIRAHQPSLFAYLLRMSRHREFAEDITQEAFVRALSHIHRYDSRFRFSTWLFTIAKRLFVNARQRLTPVFDTDVVGGSGDASPAGRSSGFSAAAASESGPIVSAAVAAAIDNLSEDQREVVVLFYQLSWPVEQIAEYLDQPEGTVKSHLHRARRKLRHALAACPQVAERFAIAAEEDPA